MTTRKSGRRECGRSCGWWRQARLRCFNPSQILVYTFTNEKSSSSTSVLIFPSGRGGPCLEMQPHSPPVADFWNSYLDEWLKFRHSQQVSPLLFKEEWDSCHLLMHCLPSGMQIPSLHRCLLARLPLLWVPKESPWVIDQVPWHHWRHVGSLPTQPAKQKALLHADLMWSVR